MEASEYKRNCPECRREIHYIPRDSFNHAKPWKKCRYCCNVIRGKTSNRKGCYHTEETKKLMSLAKLGKKQSEKMRKSRSESRKRLYQNPIEVEKMAQKVKMAMHRPDVRKKHIEALHHSKWIKVRTDKGQLELLEKWNRMGFHFEPNYQLKTDTDLFYIDGYDKEKNVVLEFDSKYHRRFGQREKDLIRQQKIIDILKPKRFWRFDSESKQIKNAIGEKFDAQENAPF